LAATHKDWRDRHSVRIGITRDVDRLLRFYENGNPHVSGAKKRQSRRTAMLTVWDGFPSCVQDVFGDPEITVPNI